LNAKRFASLPLAFALACASASASPYVPEPPPKPLRVVVALEPGMNSLGSIAGLAVSYYPVERFALDAGGGFGLLGGRAGLRGRVFFLDWSSLRFFGGASYSHAAGGMELRDFRLTVNRGGDKRTYVFSLATDPSDFLGLLAGFDWRIGNLQVRYGAGWSVLLQKRNWRVTGGTAPEDRDKGVVDLIFGGGPMTFLGFGWGF
jgi:hypothetical protein